MKLILTSFLFTIACAAHSKERVSLSPGERRLQETGETPSLPINFGESTGNGCIDYTPSGDWTSVPRNDDGSVDVTEIGIDFDWFGDIKRSLFINTNGNLSFETGLYWYDPRGFTPASTNMIAPFWADVDTRDAVDGHIWYRNVGDKFVVTWEEVARYARNDDGTSIVNPTPLTDTFQVVLSDRNSPDPKICFCYQKMQWFSGTANDLKQAQVGIAGTDGRIFNLGLFDRDDSTWNGVGTTGNGIKHLVEMGHWCFNPDAVSNTPTEETLHGTTAEIVTSDPVGDETRSESSPSGPGGDPHFTTWNKEHYEYHGQCDLTLIKDSDFAEGLGLDIQIRTKVVRHWSYIKSAAIKIGNDILEIEGSADANDAEAHYWINFEKQGELDTFAGFPVTQTLPSVYKRQYSIDLSSKYYPGASIDVQLYKEFVRIKFNGDESVFGKVVGLLGDFQTGKLVARDGSTVMNEFTDFGDEWQVLPSEPKLFHEVAHPQFPELCIKPEDPRGERKRRLAESDISIEQAEAACAILKDPLTIKDCVYDILATQDLGMIGAF
ncbi:unnamed protein product [Cylindrotheca closterium]|uniref:VWFD domain-containing protein n=1 Tax=Cylindrotheca closterium TaxID=2856 RepID=A0AAD2GEF1_9STRA|nr:unnamed protein product [Cylindrotheca closterium]